MEADGFFNALRKPRVYGPDDLPKLLRLVSQERTKALASAISAYLASSLPATLRKKRGLEHYRTNPYVLMTTSSTMHLDDPRDLAEFLVNLKLYMSLETSFGKSIESTVMGHYPVDSEDSWSDPTEKVEEFATYAGMSRELKAQVRATSVWREIDKACVSGSRRHLLSIKSGPSTINDTQVQAMYAAIKDHHESWRDSSQSLFGVDGVDVVIGLTYGTPKSTNNKENQILAKLTGSGFHEVDRASMPGVIANDDESVRVYRVVGTDFWSYVGCPSSSSTCQGVFLEVLLALGKALRDGEGRDDVEIALNESLDLLADAIRGLKFPRASLPEWVREDYSIAELSWLAAAMTVYYDAAPTPRRNALNLLD